MEGQREQTQDIDWEKKFAEKDVELKKKLESGEITVNEKPRYICVGCE